MEKVKGISIPVIADLVLDPEIYYGREITGIYFQTEDEQFGRITFYNLDAIKVCRGEAMPYEYNWETHEKGAWIFKVETSDWLAERFKYENEIYGESYEFGGDVNEMQTDFSHYLFSFHDQFVEVIARGFWFEQDEADLFGQGLKAGHPFLPLPEKGAQKIIAHGLTCQVRANEETISKIVAKTEYCPQKLFQFALELDGEASINHTLLLMFRKGELVSSLRGNFVGQQAEFNGVATLEQVKPYIEKYMSDVYKRRKAMGK